MEPRGHAGFPRAQALDRAGGGRYRRCRWRWRHWSGIGTVPAAAVADRASENVHAGPARGAAGRGQAGIRQFDRRLVRDMSRERKAVAISNDTVQLAFASKHVAYLKGDWTRQDPAITEFLREHGRDGVPLYLYYGPHAAAAEVLPQILTESTVLEAMDHPS
jgi:hypothetical protein